MSSMKNMDHSAAVDGPVGSEGGRSPSTLSTGQAPLVAAAAPTAVPAPRIGPLAPAQRWSVARGLDTHHPDDVRAWFQHSGYRST
jgi:transposase